IRRIVLLDGSATPKLEEALLQTKESSKLATLLGGPQREEALAGELQKVFNPVKSVYSGSVFTDFEQAILAAKSVALPGDIVLLSPGCASFGMFIHEFDRGEKFRNI